VNKTVTYIILTIVALIALVAVVMAINNDDSPEPSTNTTQNTTDTTTDINNQTPTDTTDQTTQGDSAEVEIEDGAFVQSSITVKAGTTVKWTNKDTIGHDVTPDTETAEFKQSEMLFKGDSYEVTFNTPGTYTYHCTPHPNMTGTIVVTE
jgi:amicyanin